MNLKHAAITIAFGTSVATADCLDLGSTYVVWWDFRECATCIDAYANAYASAHTSRKGCMPPFDSCAFTSKVATYSGCGAYAQVDTDDDLRCIDGAALANASLLGVAVTETRYPCTVGPFCPPGGMNHLGLATAVAAAGLVIEVKCEMDFSLTVCGFSPSKPASISQFVITEAVIAIVIDDQDVPTASCVSRRHSEHGSESNGLEPDDCTDLILPTVDEGVFEFRVVTVTFGPDELDINGDGRFNILDAYALEAELTSTDPDLLERFDFNNSGDIDMFDVSILHALIDCGLDHSILGDLNGDGILDCDDFDLLPASPNYVIGDSNYMIELDADLNGTNDATDRAIVYAILQPADWNNDGVVDFYDNQAYFNDYAASNPRADLNGDNTWDFFDVQAWLNIYASACQ